MKYYNAEAVLPADLLMEVRKYVPEGTLYIKRSVELRRDWGELSGERMRIDRRNHEIRARFRAAVGIEQLSLEYHLSSETIKKIVYRRG